MYYILNPYRLRVFLGAVLLLLSVGLYAQELQKPRLNFTFACASSSFNNFTFEFDFTGTAFNSDNVFIIELSNENGDFSDVVNVGTITGENSTYFDIEGSFSLPTDTYGAGYKIRIRSTSPEIIGPESDAFEAYYVPDVNLILNNNTDLVLCGSTPQEVFLNLTDDKYQFVWFYNGNPINGQTSSSLLISQPGEYYAAIEAGECTNSYQPSNKINVTSLDIGNVSIEGSNNVQICANETYTLDSSVTDASYIYRWFKDDELIDGATSPSYTTATVDQFGVYRLEVEVGGCIANSQNEVTISQQTGADFDVSFNPDWITPVILPGQIIDLIVEDNLTSASYTWFINGEQETFTSDQVRVSQPGLYEVVVTDTSGTCQFSKSIEVDILGVEELIPTIRLGANYVEDCTVSSTTLTTLGIQALASDGNLYDLSDVRPPDPNNNTPSQMEMLNYQWLKDGGTVTGATFDELTLNSYQDNGVYILQVSVGSDSYPSNELPILLTIEGIEIQSTSPSNKLCTGGSITLSIALEPGFTYTWFKDNEELTVSDPSSVEITETGVYYVSIDGYGCEFNLPEVTIEEFDASVLEVSPSTTTVISLGETATITASGADAYEWYNENGTLLSTNETLNVDQLGSYLLIGRVGNCLVEKNIEVVADDGKNIIPNILTPFNLDGVNDTWELPNRFAFQPDVRVIIYNSNGKEILNTVDYQNDWPLDNNIKDGMLFYFKVIKDDNNLIKAGTISVLK
ncbi:gliding motility-associated C-terminal domain-containing protein [Tenacibaculum sp. IB213877]|uniref:T9SS type B sorting domain-containing protein n=1 Tax=Tenacibaculum sp. IB213877 TaxID=3097351 RepID=UPI002A5AA155|nr:gliding motility-associated C-terminal domain-containing protein [Tenacibaculum sp. IB213877]MDY0779734.1 gliding motility-associated C-terminal domain-containing protein [Tenacibaculum sp. IB213877]